MHVTLRSTYVCVSLSKMMLVFNYTLSVCITDAIGTAVSCVFQSQVSRSHRKATVSRVPAISSRIYIIPSRRGFRDVFSSLSSVFLSFLL